MTQDMHILSKSMIQERGEMKDTFRFTVFRLCIAHVFWWINETNPLWKVFQSACQWDKGSRKEGYHVESWKNKTNCN